MNNLNPGYSTLIDGHSKSEDSQSTPNTYEQKKKNLCNTDTPITFYNHSW